MAGALRSALAIAVLLWPIASVCDPEASPASDAEAEALVRSHCGTCHLPPSATSFPKAQWPTVLRWMDDMLDQLQRPRVPPAVLARLTRYYEARAPETISALPPDPPTDTSRFQLDRSFPGRRHSVTDVRAVDLDQDGRLDLLVCESGGLARMSGQVTWLRRVGESWDEVVLAQTPNPARARAFDFDGDGDLDVVVAVLGSLGPSDRALGGVLLIEADGHGGFTPRTLLQGVGRVADVQPGDFNADGRMDFAVATFGHRRIGSVGWIEQTENGEFVHHELLRKPGALHVPVADLNGDGALDIVALVSQETETIFAYLGDGSGSFRSEVLFQAPPEFGSTGIELVDLDRDGDLDILHSNGDTADTGAKTGTKLRPHHGVRWLENTTGSGIHHGGNGPAELHFEVHPIIRLYGAYAATAGDIDGDGDLDIAAASVFTDLEDPGRQSLGWWENDGDQGFSGHGLAQMPVNLASIALADLDGDGRLDLVAGGMLLPGYAKIRERFRFKPTLSIWRGRDPPAHEFRED